MARSKRDDARIHIHARDARGGRVLLKRPWQRWVFFGALVAFTLIAIAAYTH